MPFRFLHIVAGYDTGGVSTFINNCVSINDENVFKSDIALISTTRKSFSKYGDIVKQNKTIKYHFDLRPFRFLKSYSEIRYELKKFDAICIHKAHPFVMLCLFFSKARNLFLFQHGYTVSSGFILKRLIKRFWYTLVGNRQGVFTICSTEFSYKKMRDSGIFIPKDKCKIIPFGINTVGIRQVNHCISDTIKIGLVGRLAKIKRFDMALESVRHYKGSLPLEVHIFGEGDEKERLQQIAMNISNKNVQVFFHGTEPDVNRIYSNFHMLFLPSKGESLGLVVLEAICRGIPVLITEVVGGAKYLVNDFGNGFILKDNLNDIEGFWEMIGNNPGILKSITEKMKSVNKNIEYDIRKTLMGLSLLVESEV